MYLCIMYVCMYACMYVRKYKCMRCANLHINSVWSFCLSVPMFVEMCVNKEVCLYVCMYVYLKGLGSIRVLIRLRLDSLNS